MVAANQPDAQSMSTSRKASTQCLAITGFVPDQCRMLVESNACRYVPPATQQGETTHYNNTSMPALTKDRLELNDLHHNHDAAFCYDLSKAIDLQQAGLELNFALPVHCYMPDKSRFDQWVKDMAK